MTEGGTIFYGSEGRGLMANGSSGEWEIAVDETTSGPDRWFIQIEGPATYCAFEVPSPATVCEALAFLDGGGDRTGRPDGASGQSGSLVLGIIPIRP
jgi:hypothetical protein